MRVALVTPRYGSLGGVETNVTAVATRLAAHGYQVEVLAQAHGPGRSCIEIIDGVTVRSFHVPVPSQNYPFAPGLWAFLARNKAQYDVIHAHHYHSLPSLGAALAGCRPLVFTPHYHGTGHSPWRRMLHVPYRRLGRKIFTHASRVICNSEAEAALVHKHFRGVASHITVIYPGVDMAALRSAEPFPQDHTIVLSAGRLEAYKNVNLVVDALAHLDRNFSLRVIGDGPARPALEERANQLGLGDRVEFLGRVDADVLRRWFRTASVYVSMSEREAYGLSVAEALAAESKAVLTDIPAHREVTDGAGPSAVSLLPVNSTSVQLAHAVRALASLPRAPVDAPNIVSWETAAAQTLRVYQAVTGRLE
ncbi:MAG: glycosyl transferase [Chloroflexi bacterium]|nr:glycosyl transferase [Chloroflexota bacterium]